MAALAAFFDFRKEGAFASASLCTCLGWLPFHVHVKSERPDAKSEMQDLLNVFRWLLLPEGLGIHLKLSSLSLCSTR